MIIEHKDERVYATWKLEGKFYQLTITTESGKIQTIFINRNNIPNPTSYASSNILGGIDQYQIEDLHDITEKALQIFEKEGMNVKAVNEVGNEDKEFAEELKEAIGV